MKHIAITFDDGRSDNFLLAKQIMDRYQFCGTVYITTGFIDGTWEDSQVLKSPTRPLKIEEISALQNSGWEIGLHGDRHQMELEDMKTAWKKLADWGIQNVDWGISAPNSLAKEEAVLQMLEGEWGRRIAYIRRGRKCDTTRLVNRILYGIYSGTKAKWAYRRFNAQNIVEHGQFNRSNIPSIVIKSKDTPELVIDLIKRMPDGSAVVFMLHSILPIKHSLCGKDPWSWGEDRFYVFCAELSAMEKRGMVRVKPLMEIVKTEKAGIAGNETGK